jgi:hypothetical protein
MTEREMQQALNAGQASALRCYFSPISTCKIVSTATKEEIYTFSLILRPFHANNMAIPIRIMFQVGNKVKPRDSEVFLG